MNILKKNVLLVLVLVGYVLPACSFFDVDETPPEVVSKREAVARKKAVVAAEDAPVIKKTGTKVYDRKQVEQMIEGFVLYELEPENTYAADLLVLKNGWRKMGSFYKAEKPFTVFGFDAKFVSLQAVGFLAGPSVTVAAPVDKIKDELVKRYQLDFHSEGEMFKTSIATNVSLAIFPHPEIKGLTVVGGMPEGF